MCFQAVRASFYDACGGKYSVNELTQSLEGVKATAEDGADILKPSLGTRAMKLRLGLGDGQSSNTSLDSCDVGVRLDLRLEVSGLGLGGGGVGGSLSLLRLRGALLGSVLLLLLLLDRHCV